MYVLISNYEMYISACAGETHSIYIYFFNFNSKISDCCIFILLVFFLYLIILYIYLIYVYLTNLL